MTQQKGDFVTETGSEIGYDKVTKNKTTTRYTIEEATVMSAKYINDHQSFREEVLQSEKPVLLDFFASWCGPCRMVSPLLDEIAGERPDIKVVKVDIDLNPELAQQYRVMSVPTLMVVKDGEVVKQSRGAKPKGQILAMLS